MKVVEAFDVDGRLIQRGDIVEILEDGGHAWLRKGFTLRVSYWEDRSMSSKEKYTCVFLTSKNGSRLCSIGMRDKKLRKVDAK